MQENKKNNDMTMVYVGLGICGLSLLLSGIFLGLVLDLFSIKIPQVFLFAFQAAFIISAIFNFWLIKYAKDKLS